MVLLPEVVGPGQPAVRQDSLRQRNLATLSASIFESAEPLSRAQLAKLTGLTRSTVSRLVEELLGCGLVVEHDLPDARGPGRPGVPLGPAPGTLVGLGIHVNVDYLSVRAIDLAGVTVAEAYVEGDYEGSDPARVLGTVAQMVADVCARVAATGGSVVGAAMALPGLVDAAERRLLLAPNLGWRELDPLEHLGDDALPAEVELALDNDANLAALAAAREAPGRLAESSTFVYITGDIGIGAAIVARGRVITGEHGWAGELGHVAIEPDGPLCLCGARGCLERYAGKHAIREAAGLPPDASGEELARAASSGYGRARLAVERAAWALGVAVADLVNIVDVGEIVLGEGFVPIIDLLHSGVEEQVRIRTLSRPWHIPVIRAASTEPALASRGGAIAALEPVIVDPVRLIDDVAATPRDLARSGT